MSIFTDVRDAVTGKSIIGAITGSDAAAQAAKDAAATQAASATQGIEEQRRQFDKMVSLMMPYVNAGTTGLQAQQNLLGLGGDAAQTSAINQIQNSPELAAMLQQGERSILQNASATGGLRGGDVQGALAQYRPNILNQLIQQKYSNLGGLSQLGQASAAGQASAGLNVGSNIANLMHQQGAAIAGGQLAAGNQQRQMFGDMLSIGGMFAGAKAGGMF